MSHTRDFLEQEHDTIKSDFQKYMVEEKKERELKGLGSKVFSPKDFEKFEQEWLEQYVEKHQIWE